MSRPAAQAWLCKHLNIAFPYVSMGKVDSLDLFGPTEMMLFAFYSHNRDRYSNALDIGANLGLHSVLMNRLGWNVKAFEPDNEIWGKCKENVIANGKWADCTPFNKSPLRNLNHVTEEFLPINAAVSDRDGEAQFTRVLNNLTGSCLVGSSKEPYGPLETITVKTVDCRPLFDWADLAKLDVEGHEGVLLKCLTTDHLTNLDLICELRGNKEAALVMDHIHSIGGTIYTQKNDWKPVQCMADMPVKHQEGSIFISSRGGPWANQ